LKYIQDLKRKVVAVLSKGGLPEHWTATNLKDVVQWYKIDEYPAMPKNIQGLIDQYQKTKHRNILGINLDTIIENEKYKRPDVTTDNIDTNPIPIPTPNPIA
jgi:hypothetical protein